MCQNTSLHSKVISLNHEALRTVPINYIRIQTVHYCSNILPTSGNITCIQGESLKLTGYLTFRLQVRVQQWLTKSSFIGNC